MPTRTPTSDRHLHRLALGAAAVLPEAQAVALLPMNAREPRRLSTSTLFEGALSTVANGRPDLPAT